MAADSRANATEPHAVRTYLPRRHRLGATRRQALQTGFPRFAFRVADLDQIDLRRLFGNSAPTVLEIGSGMGEAVVALARADPARNYLAAETHLPGVATLLLSVERERLGNVRVAQGDALQLIRLLPPDSLAAVNVFFPDPWPKTRHHKRRLIQPTHVALIRSRISPGGILHCTTDWLPYAEQMLRVLAADPGLDGPHGPEPRPADRPVTRFEQRAIAAGRPVVDIVVRRCS